MTGLRKSSKYNNAGVVDHFIWTKAPAVLAEHWLPHLFKKSRKAKANVKKGKSKSFEVKVSFSSSLYSWSFRLKQALSHVRLQCQLRLRSVHCQSPSK